MNEGYLSPSERLELLQCNWDTLVEAEGRYDAGRMWSEACKDCNMMDAWRRERSKRENLTLPPTGADNAYFERGNLYVKALDGEWEDWVRSDLFLLEVWAQKEYLRSHSSSK